MRVVIQNSAEAPVTIGRDLTPEQLAFLREIAYALNAQIINYEPFLYVWVEGEDEEFKDYEFVFERKQKAHKQKDEAESK